MAWRYLLFDVNGDGTETLVHGELPLKNPTLTRALSTPHQISATLAVPTSDLLREDGTPVIRRWRSAIYAEAPNEKLWVGGLVAGFDIDGPEMTLDVAGFTAYPVDEPYDSESAFVDVDPLDIVRHIWSWLQGQQGANLGLVLDETTTPARVGTPERDVSFTTGAGEQVDFEAGPVKLNWWTTENLAAEIDKLAKATPFDTLEEHTWEPDDTISHRLRLGYPSIGSRQDDLRFVLGENVFKMPAAKYDPEDVVTGVRVLGAGEGRDRIHGEAYAAPQDSLRRIKTIVDKTITSKERATERASEELARYRPDITGEGITELVIRNKDSAPFGSYDVGDEILYSGDHDWGEVDVWVKIVKLTIRPEESDDVIASVVRADTLR